MFAYLKISHSEAVRLAYVGGAFFLIALGVSFGRIGRDALFIQEIGAGNLSIIYICNAVLMVVISAVYARVYDRVSRSAFLMLLLASSAGVVVLLRYSLNFEHNLAFYALYILSEAIIVLVPMHFWTFANEVFDPRAGKRVFPLIGAAGLVGTIVGGTLTGIFSDRIGTLNLLLIWAGVFLFTTPLVLRFRLVFGRLSPFGRGHTEETGLLQHVSEIWRMPLTRTLTLMAVPMWLTVYIVDFQYFLALEEAFHTRDELSSALGVVHGVTSGAGLLLQIFFTSRIIKVFGVGRAVSVYPFAMGLGSLGLVARLFLPAGVGSGIFNLRVLPAVFAHMCDEAVTYSVGESANQLLYNAVVEEWRGHARAFITGVMEPVTVAGAGIFLLAFGLLDFSPDLLPFIALGLAFFWLYVSRRVHGDYMNALVGNLSSHNIDTGADLVATRQALSELSRRRDPRAGRRLYRSLFSGDEQVALMAVELLAGSGQRENIGKLAGALELVIHPGVRVAILNTLAEHGDFDDYDLVLHQLTSEHPGVRAACVRTAGLLGGQRSLGDLAGRLRDPDPEVRAEALIVQLRERKRLDSRNEAVHQLRRLIRSRDPAARLRAAHVIRESGKSQLHDDLLRLARTKHPALRREVLRALGVIGDTRTLPFLRDSLGDDQLMYHAMESVERVGARHLGELLRMVQREPDGRIKENMIHCLGKIGDPRAVHVLAGMLADHSIDVENATLESLTQIRAGLLAESGRRKPTGGQSRPDAFFHEGILRLARRGLHALTLSLRKKSWALQVVAGLEESDARWLLHDALTRSYARKEKAALTYLELVADPTAVRAAAADLRGDDERAQADAIELIEGIGPEGEMLARAIEPKYFPVTGEQNATAPDRTALPVVLMEQLLSKDRSWFYGAVLFAVGEYKMKGMVSILRGQATSEDPLVRGNARLALSKLRIRKKRNRTKEVKTMAANMERMLFLRSVPLFWEVDGDDIYWINEITRERHASGGDIIFRENDEGDALYIVVSGTVRVFKGETSQVTLDVLQQRDVFGEMSILDQEPRSATVETIEDSRLLVIMRDDFQRLLLARPRIAFSLFKTLSGRLRHLSTRLREVESGKN